MLYTCINLLEMLSELRQNCFSATPQYVELHLTHLPNNLAGQHRMQWGLSSFVFEVVAAWGCSLRIKKVSLLHVACQGQDPNSKMNIQLSPNVDGFLSKVAKTYDDPFYQGPSSSSHLPSRRSLPQSLSESELLPLHDLTWSPSNPME